MYTNSPAGAAFESQNIYLGDSGDSCRWPGVHFGASGRSLDARGDVWASDVVSLSVVCGFWAPVGDHFVIILVTFSEFVVSMWEVGLWTSFLMHFGRKKRPADCSLM